MQIRIHSPSIISTLLTTLILSGCWISRESSRSVSDPSSASAIVEMGADAGLAGLYRLRPGRSHTESSADPNWQGGNDDNRSIEPGGTLTLGEMKGPGVIRHIWTTSEGPEMWHISRAVLRMYWDGETEPSVECPLGDFFGEAHGMRAALRSIPVYVDGNGTGRNCFWPMPFRKSARITLTNEGERRIDLCFWQINWEEAPDLPGNAAYFHCQYRQEHPAVPGRNYTIAEIEGRGHYVGTVFAVKQNKPGWWGEGDHFFFIDGEEAPSLRGTGTEDYFGDAWGLQVEEGSFAGAPLVEGRGVGERTTAYRWHVLDPIRFDESLRMEMEMKDGRGDRSDDVSSAAFWYQVEPHKTFAPLPPAADRLYPVIKMQGEDLLDAAVASNDSLSIAEHPQADGGAYLRWDPDTTGGELEIELPFDKGGRYEVHIGLVYGPDHGVFDVSVQGTKMQSGRSLHRGKTQYHSFACKTINLEKGANFLRVKNLGKGGAKRCAFGLDWVGFYPKN